MSFINPTGNTGNREVANLSTLTAPELYDLQKRMIEKNPRLKDIGKQFTGLLMSLYNTDPFTGEFKTITELSLNTYGYRQPEGTPAKASRFGIGRTFNFSYDDYGVSYVATERALMNAENHRTVLSEVLNLTSQLHERRYLNGVHRFTFGAVASYTDMDGVVVNTTGIDGLAIFHTAHTLPHSATTFSNIVSGAPVLAKTGIITAANMFKTAVLDGFGVQKRMVPDTIVITDEMSQQYTARQIFGSDTELGQSNAGVINALPKYKIVSLPLFDSDANGASDTSKKNWWILGRFGMDGVDARYCERYGISENPVIIENDTTRNRVFSAKSANRFVIVSGIGMCLSQAV